MPIHPEFVTLLRDHMDDFGSRPSRRIFTGPRGGVVAEWTYLEVLHEARKEALSDADAAATPLMSRPYDLRHAAVTTWLNAGIPAAQVTEWAGHSTDVLLRVYVKCMAGQQVEAGDPAGAAAAYQELLTDMQRLLGPDHHNTLSARANLALWRESVNLGLSPVTGRP